MRKIAVYTLLSILLISNAMAATYIHPTGGEAIEYTDNFTIQTSSSPGSDAVCGDGGSVTLYIYFGTLDGDLVNPGSPDTCDFSNSNTPIYLVGTVSETGGSIPVQNVTWANTDSKNYQNSSGFGSSTLQEILEAYAGEGTQTYTIVVEENFDFQDGPESCGPQPSCYDLSPQSFEVNSLCEPSWVCSGYGECQFGDYQECNAVTDENTCGESYTGDYSEFSTQNCDWNTDTSSSTQYACDNEGNCQLYSVNGYTTNNNIQQDSTGALLSVTGSATGAPAWIQGIINWFSSLGWEGGALE